MSSEAEFQVNRDTGVLTHLPTGRTMQLPTDYKEEELARAVEDLLNRGPK